MSISLGTVSAMTKGGLPGTLLDSEEKIRQGALVWYSQLP